EAPQEYGDEARDGEPEKKIRGRQRFMHHADREKPRGRHVGGELPARRQEQAREDNQCGGGRRKNAELRLRGEKRLGQGGEPRGTGEQGSRESAGARRGAVPRAGVGAGWSRLGCAFFRIAEKREGGSGPYR